MSKFAKGYKSEELPPNAPWTWIYDENAVRTQGEYWGKFRTQSIAFHEQYPQNYAEFPAWNTIDGGVFRILPEPQIPISDTTFGIIHGDAHTGNYMIDYLGDDLFDMTAIDLDRAQQSWYVIDIGDVVF